MHRIIVLLDSETWEVLSARVVLVYVTDGELEGLIRGAPLTDILSEHGAVPLTELLEVGHE